MNVTAAFPVREASQVAVPRRAVLWLAEQLGLSEEQGGRAALIVSELATNLVKYARGGEILLRSLCSATGERHGLEIVSVDAGPGMDHALAREDGYSTSGTLGHGLGAVERQAGSFDFYTHTSGTVIVATISGVARHERSEPQGRYDVGAVHVSKDGEDVCGDAWAWRMRDDRLAIMVADGLGHGLYAHDAAVAATAVFGKDHENDPARVVTDVHAALRATRGAAVAMLAVDMARGSARYSGLGNVASTILAGSGARQHLVSHNGTAGHTAARIQEFNYPVGTGSTIVMATDGLGTHWDLSLYPGWRSRSATTVAALLYRDFSRRRDDVTVVVAKERPSLAEKL